VRAGQLSSIPENSVRECIVAGTPYAVCNVGGTIRAVSGICPHQGGPLGQGNIHEGRVVCPYHMWEFDCVTGEYDYNASLRIPTYPIKIEGDEILIEVP